jgi:hypothetical protein
MSRKRKSTRKQRSLKKFFDRRQFEVDIKKLEKTRQSSYSDYSDWPD